MTNRLRTGVAIGATAVLGLVGASCSDDDNDGNEEIEVPEATTPDVDAPDVDVPDIDVEGGEAPEVDVEGGETPDVDVEEGG